MTTETTKDTTYNGWTNYDTWNVKLWIDNEQGSSDYWIEIAQEIWDGHDPNAITYKWDTREDMFTRNMAEAMKESFEENMPTMEYGVYADLLSAAMSEVNWHEIAEHYLDKIDKTQDAADDGE